ncbi:MAG TPA: ABATE domain-containing protein [Syntrophales bacterium]|jgi:predicted RNA-binding Zn ribbon-like protein|nr:ABATE domain-containing protein [Syntrophales bacterium]HOU77527.1 ABATE domain-containing protein [Syntrophales bacterium]HPC31951.1 ABATE domain-containing protein [Syntrophales bacterium]HQG34773.1 ABATE domain-containing protein [Syntrophales bacterium]HQI36439.1 ABATE domain-containing protein [Syntrophales bacterium]
MGARRNSHPKYRQFRFDAGSLALNFVATVRHRGSEPRDLLGTPEALRNWLHQAGLFFPEVSPTSKDHETAVGLREAIHDAVKAIILKTKPLAADIERINGAALFPTAVPRLHADADAMVWETKNPLKSCLSVIARDAITIVSGADRDHLKMCKNGSCRMLFLDNSPANRRRWCAMSICGNREKIRMHRQRKKLDE